MRTALILDLLFDANDRMGAPVPLTEFHNWAISEAANLKEEYLVSHHGDSRTGFMIRVSIISNNLTTLNQDHARYETNALPSSRDNIT